MRRTSVRLIATASACGVLVSACSSGNAGPVVLPAVTKTIAGSPPIAASSKIKHVIVVVLENRSFDNLFAADPALAGVTDPPVDVDSAKTAMSKGAAVTLAPTSLSDSTYDEDHSHGGFLADDDGGLDDGWAATAYGYVPQAEIQPYYDMASQFAIGDRFFHGVTGPTFPSHLEIGAGTTFGVIGNPSDTAWTCDSKPGTVTDLYDPSAPGEVDAGKGPFPCFDDLSIFDLLDRARPAPISWKFDVSSSGNDITGELNVAAYFRHIRFGPDWNTDIAASDAQITTDLTAGTLPQVSFVIPNDTATDHAGYPSLGPTYLKNLVNTFGQSAYFDDTLMMITWDDWGGWYDHVPPPRRADGSQLSFRKPILFIGGYVKHNYCTHVQTEDASIAKTIEEIFNLGTLGQHDVAANGFDDVIDVTQTPPAFVPIASNQGETVPASAIAPPATFGGLRTRSAFRVIPADFMRASARTGDDYYGRRAADY